MFSAAKKRANLVLTMAVLSWSRSTRSCLAQSCPTTRCLSSCEMAEQPNNIAISRSKPGNFYFLNRVRDLGGPPTQLTCIFEPVNPPKQGRTSNQNKGPHLGSRSIYISLHMIPDTPCTCHVMPQLTNILYAVRRSVSQKLPSDFVT